MFVSHLDSLPCLPGSSHFPSAAIYYSIASFCEPTERHASLDFNFYYELFPPLQIWTTYALD